jgi:hypothetical protein
MQLVGIEILAVKEERLAEIFGRSQIHIAGADAMTRLASRVASRNKTEYSADR